MSKVNTVLGSVSPDELGITLMHEHVVSAIGSGYLIDDSVAPFDREGCVKAALETFAELKTYGVRTYVDATPIDLGRDVALLREISEKSGVNIVCSTGLYYEKNGASAYYQFRRSIPLFDVVQEMEELFVTEITRGIGKSGVKAGVIKVATGHGAISAYEETVLRAAARAQKATGVPIITHTEAGTMGPEQADLLIAEGVEPGKIMIGHAGGSGDMKYHTAILDKGVYLSFDRIGLEVLPEMSDRWTLSCLLGLMGIGFTERLMMSHDSIVKWLGRPMDVLGQLQPNWHPRRVFTYMLPAFTEAGVTEQKIKTILQDNPRRLFAGN